MVPVMHADRKASIVRRVKSRATLYPV